MAWRRNVAAMMLAALAGAAPAQQYQPPQHVDGPWPVFDGVGGDEVQGRADAGTELQRNRDPRWELAEARKLTADLATLQPPRKGQVNAYVVSIALDSDPVFGREAREAGRVLSERYGAQGHTIVLAGSDGSGESTLPMGSPDALAATLARVRELMDPDQDVLILYTTGHGAKFGLAYHDGDQGFGAISPLRMWSMLRTLGIRRKMLMLSACFAGIFVPQLADDDSVVMTAADADHTSFGCMADNDWTFFGDALINHALRKPQPIDAVYRDARAQIAGWETQGKLTPSNPQFSMGKDAGMWLSALERKLPSVGTPVGRPATNALAGLAH